MKRFLLASTMLALLFGLANAGIRTTHAQNMSVIVSQTPIGAAATSGSSTITASSTYYVRACGLKKNAATVIDTTGGGLFNRATYTSGSNGCVNYSTTAYNITGACLLTIQQFAGQNLQVVGSSQFTIS